MRGCKTTLLALSAIFCVMGCADPETGDVPEPDPDRDRVLEVVAVLRPELEDALGDSFGAEVEVLRVTEEECKEKVKEALLARSPKRVPNDKFEDAWETSLLIQSIGGWGGVLPIITDLQGRLCFVDLPEDSERLRAWLVRELIRVYQIRNFEIPAFIGAAGDVDERSIRAALVDSHRRFVVRRLKEDRGEPPHDPTAKARKNDPVCLMTRRLRVGVLEAAAFEARLDRYVAVRSEGLSPAEAWKRIFASPPKSIWEVVGIKPEVQPGFDLAMTVRDRMSSSLKVSPLMPVLPDTVEGSVLTAGADRALAAGSLLQAGFAVSAASAEDGACGRIRVRVMSVANAEFARILEEIWLGAERNFDSFARAGSRFSVLVEALYEPASIGAWRGTRIRRLEDDLSKLDYEFVLGPWERQETLLLTSGSILLVVEVDRPFEFAVDALGLARWILTGTGAESRVASTDRTEEALRSLLSHPDPQLRCWSLFRLEEEDWDRMLPEELLGPLLEDANIRVRAAAFRVLAGQLDSRAKTSQAPLPLLLASCTHEDAELRANAFLCLNRLSDTPGHEMQVLLDGLDDPVASVRYRAFDAWTAAWSDDVPPPASAAPTLLRMAEDPVEQIRWLAASAIRDLDSSVPDVAPVLLEILTSEHEYLRAAAAEAFRQSWDASPEVIEALRRMRKEDESESAREAAGRALRRLTGE